MTDPIILDELEALLADLDNDRDGARGVRAVLGLRLEAAARSLIDDARHLAAMNDPQWDATDAAHPSWWRGNDAGVYGVVKVVNEWLDGLRASGVYGYAPLTALRERIHAVVDALSTCDHENCDLTQRLKAMTVELAATQESLRLARDQCDRLRADIDAAMPARSASIDW